MKRFLGILFLLIIAAAGVTVFFFPGIPYYYKCTHDLKSTENILTDIPSDLPPIEGGTSEYSSLGLKLTAWKDMEAQRTDDKNQALWENKDRTHVVSIYTENIGGNFDFLDRTGISHEDLDRYCKKIKKSTPDGNLEFVRLIASLTMDDFDIHDFSNAATFYKMMKIKNDMYISDDYPVRIYTVDGVGYRGFLLIAQAPDESLSVINIYPEKDKHVRYVVGTSVNSWDEVKSIADSIKLTE